MSGEEQTWLLALLICKAFREAKKREPEMDEAHILAEQLQREWAGFDGNLPSKELVYGRIERLVREVRQ